MNLNFFENFRMDVLSGEHDLVNDDIKLGFITDEVFPHKKEKNNNWFKYRKYEVNPGGHYPQGGISLTDKKVFFNGRVPTFSADDIRIERSFFNPANVSYAILYNDTNKCKFAIGYQCVKDFRTTLFRAGFLPVSIRWGYEVKWARDGILTIENGGYV